MPRVGTPDALSQGWTTTRAGALVATARPASDVKGATTGQAHKPAAGRSKATIAALREPSVRDQLLELELEQRRRRLAADRGIYIRTEGLAAEVVKGFQRFIASADNDLAGEIGLDNEGLAVLRASWRRFREREADVALAFAERLPEVLPDAAQSR